MSFADAATVAVITATLTALLVTPISIYLTAWLGVRRFRIEKWWEKRVSVYEEIFESLHDFIEYYDKETERLILDRKYSDEYMKELGEAARKARSKLIKRQRIGSFVISDAAEKILRDLENEFSKEPRPDSWFEYLDQNLFCATQAFDALRVEARRDLGLETKLPGEDIWPDFRDRIRNRPGQSDLGAPAPTGT